MKTRASPEEPHTGILVPPGWSSHFLLSRVVKSSSKTVLPEIFPPIRIWKVFFKKTNFQYGFKIGESSVFLFICVYLSDCSTLASHGKHPVRGLSERFCLCGLLAQLARSNRKQIDGLTKPFTTFMGQTMPLETTCTQAGKAKFGLHVIIVHAKFLFKDSRILRHFSSNSLPGF